MPAAVDDALSNLIRAALGEPPVRLSRLHGGCVAHVFKAEFDHHPTVAVKHEPAGGPGGPPALDVEGFMLGHLAERTALPLPDVIHAEPKLLVLEFVPNNGHRSDAGEAALADLLADLHDTRASETTYGLELDTRIGPLVQPNSPAESWAAFYRDQRLFHFGALALSRGVIAPGTHDSLRRLGDHLERLLEPTTDDSPRLLHGDLWAGNILWDDGQPRALIDPACHRGHPEVETAFIDLMGGLGPAFWHQYRSRRPDQGENRGVRRSIYTLYPLLVHAILFDRATDGGREAGYAATVRATLDRLLAGV